MFLIPESDVERMLDLTELRNEMEHALIDFSLGRVTQPLRTVLRIEQHDGWFGLMPAIYQDVIGAKLVTVYPNNADRGLHTHDAMIHLFRTETGEPLAVVGGRVITALRTAAVSTLATRALARQDSRVLALLGSGVQARTHLQALKLVFEFDEVRVWSRTAEHAARFAKETGARATTAEQAVSGADVIVTVTNASEPVLHGAWLKEGAHVNAIGAVGPYKREIDDEAMRNSAVIVESREAALRESVDITKSGASIYAELGELLAGTKPPPQSRTTIYKSLGIAVEDVAAARLVYLKARAETAEIAL